MDSAESQDKTSKRYIPARDTVSTTVLPIQNRNTQREVKIVTVAIRHGWGEDMEYVAIIERRGPLPCVSSCTIR